MYPGGGGGGRIEREGWGEVEGEDEDGWEGKQRRGRMQDRRWG